MQNCFCEYIACMKKKSVSKMYWGKKKNGDIDTHGSLVAKCLKFIIAI